LNIELTNAGQNRFNTINKFHQLNRVI
jgi:hypothetical protein